MQAVLKGGMFVAALALVVGLAAQPARAVTVPVDFTGPNQGLSGVVSAYGTFFGDGTGQAFNVKSGKVEPFVATPPLNHPVSVEGGFVGVKANPVSVNAPTTQFTLSGGQVTDVSDLDLNLLNGSTSSFALSTVTITTNSNISLLQNVTVDVTADLSSFGFEQTGAATFTPLSAGFGTFSVPGRYSATLSNIHALLFSLLDNKLSNVALTVDGPLTGQYQVTGPANDTKISLDGAMFPQLPLTTFTAYTAAISAPLQLTATVTAQLIATLSLAAGYHLEQTGIIVPEPGSIILLGVGLAALVPLVARRRK